MALSKEKKHEVVEAVQHILDTSECVTFVNFHGLTVGEVDEMRSELRSKEVGYTVVKKRLAYRALDGSQVTGERPTLDGELALAYSADILASAQEIYAQQKKREDAVSITGGIFDGEYKNQEEMLRIAQIPSLDTLRGQFVNIINSPIQGFVGVLNQIAQQKETA